MTPFPVDNAETHRPAANIQPQLRPKNARIGEESDGFSDVIPVAGPPPEGRGEDGGRRPPGPGRRGPDRGGKKGKRGPPHDGPEGDDRMDEGLVSEHREKLRRGFGDMEGEPRSRRAAEDKKPDDHSPERMKPSLFGAPEKRGDLTGGFDQSGN